MHYTDPGGIIIGEIKINNILYSDDLLLLANSIKELERLLKITEKYGSDFEIKYNPSKTNYIIFFDNKKNINSELIIFQGNIIERVDKIKYLGIWIDEKLTSKSNLKKRIPSYSFSFYQLKNCGITSEHVTTEVKLCFYKIFTRPVLYYGIENFSLSKTQMISLQRLESTFI